MVDEEVGHFECGSKELRLNYLPLASLFREKDSV